MDTHSQSQGEVRPGGGYQETGAVVHDGRSFTSGGATVTDLRLTAYLADGGKVQTWGGETIGRYTVSSRWRMPNGILSNTMESVSIRLADGRRYVGRSMGVGMIVFAKRAACDVASWPRRGRSEGGR